MRCIVSGAGNVGRAVAGWTLLLPTLLLLSCDGPTSLEDRCGLSPVPGAPFPYACPEEVGLHTSDLEEVEARIQRWVESDTIVGAEFMLVKDRRIVFHKAFGMSDRERGIELERNSIYRIRSMTKPFTGTAVQMLVEEGSLALDDRASDYLPSWDNDRSREITIRQLLTHTSGLPRNGPADTHWSEFPSLRALVDVIGEEGPDQAPGSGYVYSNIGSATLGAIVAEVSGMPLEDFLQSRIFDPLGLDDTFSFFTPTAPWASRMNSTYWWNGEEWEKYWDNTMEQIFPFFRGAGGLYSTVFDYARFLTTWMDLGAYPGGRLLSPETVLEALQPRPADEHGDYGYHWQVWGQPPSPGTPAVFGHAGYNGTIGAAVPFADALLLYFTQSTETETLGLMVVGVIDILAQSGT